MKIRKKVFTLPMRNWNMAFFGIENWSLMFLLYLWGIETTIVKNKVWNFFYKFLLYLWGIETRELNGKIEELIAFLLYLWGIETGRNFRPFFCPIGGFYFTYEELKQEGVIELTFHPDRFYFTYEELKPQSVNV